LPSFRCWRLRPLLPLPRRTRDYTPATPGWTIPANRPASGMATGGAEAFLDFVERRVQPLVRQRWPVDRSRETLKPSIPTHNPENGLPISDEIELTLAL